MKALIKKEKEEVLKDNNLAERIARLNTLMFAANEDSAKLSELQAFLNQNTDLHGRVRILAFTVKENLLAKLTTDSGCKALINEELEGITDQLNFNTSNALEKMLIESVMMCWLRLQYAEAYRNSMLSGEHYLKEVEFAEKMLTKAHNRFLKAVNSLAKSQKNKIKMSKNMNIFQTTFNKGS